MIICLVSCTYIHTYMSVSLQTFLIKVTFSFMLATSQSMDLSLRLSPSTIGWPHCLTRWIFHLIFFPLSCSILSTNSWLLVTTRSHLTRRPWRRPGTTWGRRGPGAGDTHKVVITIRVLRDWHPVTQYTGCFVIKENLKEGSPESSTERIWIFFV